MSSLVSGWTFRHEHSRTTSCSEWLQMSTCIYAIVPSKLLGSRINARLVFFFEPIGMLLASAMVMTSVEMEFRDHCHNKYRTMSLIVILCPAIIGVASWSIYLPERFDARPYLFLSLLFSFIGALFQNEMSVPGNSQILLKYVHDKLPLCLITKPFQKITGKKLTRTRRDLFLLIAALSFNSFGTLFLLYFIGQNLLFDSNTDSIENHKLELPGYHELERFCLTVFLRCFRRTNKPKLKLLIAYCLCACV